MGLFRVFRLSVTKKKKFRKTLILRNLSAFDLLLSLGLSGETGIRTPGTSQYNGFQDRRNRPLCHLSKTSSLLLFKSLISYSFQLKSEVLSVKSGAKIQRESKIPNVFLKKMRQSSFFHSLFIGILCY